jgi:hypothetical protein
MLFVRSHLIIFFLVLEIAMLTSYFFLNLRQYHVLRSKIHSQLMMSPPITTQPLVPSELFQVMACRNALANSGELGKRRRRQAETWMWEELRAQVVLKR